MRIVLTMPQVPSTIDDGCLLAVGRNLVSVDLAFHPFRQTFSHRLELGACDAPAPKGTGWRFRRQKWRGNLRALVLGGAGFQACAESPDSAGSVAQKPRAGLDAYPTPLSK